MTKSIRATWLPFLVPAAILAGCAGAANSAAPPLPPPTAPSSVAAAPITSVVSPPPTSPAAAGTPAASVAAPLDEKVIAEATGVDKPESANGTIKVSFPRKDVPIAIDGWQMPPFMGLTSWAAFSPGTAGKAEAMVMGDLVLFEDEVNPVMSALFQNGVDVTALHNHFFYDSPRVLFMHVGGEGSAAGLAKGIKAAMDTVAELRKNSPKPKASYGLVKLPVKSTIDSAKIESALGVKGQSKDGMFKAVMGRETNASCGCSVGKAMGVNTWAAFAGADDNAVVDGDFAVAEAELQPVLRALRSGGINIVAIHQHMTGETPRILFLHYWGRGKTTDLATTVKKALDLTAWDGKAKAT